MVVRLAPNQVHTGMRLDTYLHSEIESYSKRTIRQIIEIGGVHVDGRRVRRCSLEVAAGQRIEVYLDGRSLTPFRITSDLVLFHDEFLIAINKPAGIDTQPTAAHFQGTLYEALLVWLDRRHLRRPEIGMVQRLDRNTSGVIVFSIHPRAHRQITQQFTDHQAVKTYLALVVGAVTAPAQELRATLIRERKSGLMRVSDTYPGKEARSRYRLIATIGGASLLEVELITGRTHQVRAQFAALGHPLMGDRQYGGPRRLGKITVDRQWLHSHRLRFIHPKTGLPVVITAPLPDDLRKTIPQEIADSYSYLNS
jgi:23S rRNA pseudouridine1911/1915/1917 synthase